MHPPDSPAPTPIPGDDDVIFKSALWDEIHRRAAWGVQREIRRLLATRLVGRLPRFRGGLPAGLRRVGHGEPK
jgi:hypothetical protein